MVWKGPMAIVRGTLAEKYDPKYSDAALAIEEFEDVRSTDLDMALNYLRTCIGQGVLMSVRDPEAASAYRRLRSTEYDFN